MLQIVTYENDILKQKSYDVDVIDDELRLLADEMFDIMYKTNGIGLSAVQVGILKRLFVMDVPGFGKHIIINPKIIETSKETSICEEGCLSIPGISSDVERSKEVVIEYTDIDGNVETLKASGLLAVCAQHEYDHLEGKLFIDRLPIDEKLKKVKEYREIHIV